MDQRRHFGDGPGHQAGHGLAIGADGGLGGAGIGGPGDGVDRSRLLLGQALPGAVVEVDQVGVVAHGANAVLHGDRLGDLACTAKRARVDGDEPRPLKRASGLPGLGAAHLVQRDVEPAAEPHLRVHDRLPVANEMVVIA